MKRLFVFLPLCLALVVFAGPQASTVRFSNIAAQAGIDFKHESGATPEKYMPETMGAGALILDYDGDDWPDIFPCERRFLRQ